MRSYLLKCGCCWVGTVAIACLLSQPGRAQVPQQAASSAIAQATADDTPSAELTTELHAKFKKLLTGAKLRGQFTIDGQPLNNLQEEAYDIEKVDKLPDGDLWALTTKIKYGDHDLTVPIAVEVKWAGSTPVITLDELTIPGLGTFSARVLLHKDKYAGTWQHDSVGGHLFGKIELAH